MDSIKQLMKKPPSECATQETTQPPRIFNQQEKDSVAYFFLRLSNIYLAEYSRQLPDDDGERMAKREYAERLCQFNREQIDKGCTWIHQQKENHAENWQFLDIDRCIGAIKQANTVKACHRPFQPDRALEDQGARDRANTAGVESLAAMKGLFTSTRDTTIEEDLTDRSWAGKQGAIE